MLKKGSCNMVLCDGAFRFQLSPVALTDGSFFHSGKLLCHNIRQMEITFISMVLLFSQQKTIKQICHR
jgi:hypothetical protein